MKNEVFEKNEQVAGEVNINRTVESMTDSIEKAKEEHDSDFEEQTKERVKIFQVGYLPAIIGWIISGIIVWTPIPLPSVAEIQYSLGQQSDPVGNMLIVLVLTLIPSLIVWLPLAYIANKIGRKRGQKAAILFVICGGIIYLISARILFE